MVPGVHRNVPPREPDGEPALPGPTRPDRISIWPVETDRYGIDVLFHGVAGFRRADTIQRQLEAGGVASSLRQEPGGGWTVRFGPVTRDEMLTILGGYVW